VKKGDLSAPLEKVAFTLPVGEVSPVIDADYGFHILKIDARTDEALKPFPEVRNDVEAKIQADRFAPAYADYMKKAWADATIWVSPKYRDRLSDSEPAK
jgi:parvulin-like peptidyl-prolyl isomerase